jgi:hypothetical protein
MLPDSFGKGDLVRAAFSVYVTGAACLLGLYAQIIGESNSKTRNIFDNVFVVMIFSLIF